MSSQSLPMLVRMNLSKVVEDGMLIRNRNFV